jgi:hypothetical protein
LEDGIIVNTLAPTQIVNGGVFRKIVINTRVDIPITPTLPISQTNINVAIRPISIIDRDITWRQITVFMLLSMIPGLNCRGIL